MVRTALAAKLAGAGSGNGRQRGGDPEAKIMTKIMKLILNNPILP